LADIETLKSAFMKAHKAGDEKNASILARALKAEMANTSTPPAEDPGLLGSLKRGVDSIAEGFGSTAEVLGAPETGSALKGAIESKGPSATEQFMAPEGILNFDWSQLPNAVAENLPDMAGVAASAGAGAAVGAPLAPFTFGLSVPAGGLIGGALYGIGRNTGDRAKARAANDGREGVSASDIAIGAGIGAVEGAIDKFGVGKVAGGLVKSVAKGAAKEALTEAAQTGVEEAGTTAGTEKGLTFDPKEIAGSAILGGTTGGTFHAVGGVKDAAVDATGKALTNLRTDDTSKVDEYDVLARDLLQEGADYKDERLGEVRTTKKGSAKEAANAALRIARGRMGEASKRLRQLATARKDTEALETLSSVDKVIAHQGSDLPEELTSKLQAYFGGEPDVERLVSHGHASKRISEFTQKSNEDMGGLSKTTKNWDLFDGRNTNPLMKYAQAGGFGGIALGAPHFAALPIAGIAANRAARTLDNFTNRRSAIKRYTDTVTQAQAENPNLKLPDMTGQNAWQTLAQMRRAEQDAKIDSIRTEARSVNKEDIAAARQDAKAEAERIRGVNMGIHLQNTAGLFAGRSGLEKTPAHEPYHYWKAATSLDPAQVVETMVQLEDQGAIPEGTAKRFRADPRSFSTDANTPEGQQTYLVQEAVRKAAAPTYEGGREAVAQVKAMFKGKGDGQKPGGTNTSGKFRDANSAAPTGSRRRQKAFEGDRRYKNLLSQVESDGSLKPEERAGLMELADEINTPLATADQRKQIVEQRIGEIVRGKARQAMWKTNFRGLASIGNDISIKRGDTPEQIAEKAEAQDEKVKTKGRKKRAKRRQADRTGASSPNGTPSTPEAQTRGSRAAQKLLEASKAPLLLTDQRSESEKAVADREPKPKPEPQGKGPMPKGNKKSLTQMVFNRINQLTDTIITATSEKATDLQKHVESLPKSTEGRVEAMLYEFPSQRLTINMLIDSFAEKNGVPVRAAVESVVETLNHWAATGRIKIVKQFKQDKLAVGGVQQRDTDGKPLEVRHIEILDPAMKDRMETAQAVRMHRNMVDQSQMPQDYTPGQIKQGPQRAFKDYDGERLQDGSNWDGPLAFLNAMRKSGLGVSDKMLTQIEDGLRTLDGKRNLLQLGDALRPEGDDSPLRAAAQLLQQLGLKGARRSNLLRQEWMFGSNLRVYSKNGSASSQGGDLMKGILRAPSKQKLGNGKGVDFLFHSFGNLLGYDKESPLARRQALLKDPEMVDELVRFAENPFGLSTIYTGNDRKRPKPLQAIIAKGEDFFQVLNVAHEVADMVKWARIRHPDLKARSNTELLAHPKVRADLANYETSFISQLDANNNAYQLVGLLLGDPTILQATGMQPTPGVDNPDSEKGQDIYMKPALSIAERVPELAAKLEERGEAFHSSLRKLFKRPIGTYLYAAAFNSRRDAFADILADMAGDESNVFGREGSLFQLAEPDIQAVTSPEGRTFNRMRYSNGGREEAEEAVQKRIVKGKDKKGDFWKVETLDKDKWRAGADKHRSEEDALSGVFADDLYVRLNRELVRDMQTRFPRVQEYLNFSRSVTEMLKDKGQTTVKVPTPDGLTLDYDLAEVDVYDGHKVTLQDGSTVNLGQKTGDVKHRGQGLAAFIAHMHDAYVMRETWKRMTDNGGLSVFNPIHDSFGSHPSEAERMQATVLQIMQELGDQDHNIFEQILELNGIDPMVFMTNGGVIPMREHVNPVPASAIPTAVS
jgi:hypothetical protein